MTEEELINCAEEAAKRSYSPYSRFRVGAAIECADGRVITGTNVENRSFGLTNCAERTAIFTAISLGLHDFKSLAVICLDSEIPVPPCGACRQVISEFVNPDFPVIYGTDASNVVKTTMQGLLPFDSMHDLKNR